MLFLQDEDYINEQENQLLKKPNSRIPGKVPKVFFFFIIAILLQTYTMCNASFGFQC